MKKKKILKKLNIKKKYDFSYLYKPLLVLSAFSVIMYILKLNGFIYADNLFLFAELTLLLSCYINHCRSFRHILISLLIAFSAMIMYISFGNSVFMFIANKCQKSGVSFGVVNMILNTFSLDDLEKLIYHTAFGGSKFINGEIVTGAVDIYNAKKGAIESATFLCGKYLSLFPIVGIALSFNKHRKEIYLIALASILTGNVSIYLIALLLNFTPLYFLLLFFTFFCYFVANVVGIRSGFFCNGSIIELFIQKDNLVYILAIGIFITAVSYYVSRLVKEKLKW